MLLLIIGTNLALELIYYSGRRGRQRVRALLMSHVLGANSKIGENEGQIHLDVHTLSPLGVKLVRLVSDYWNSTQKVRYYIRDFLSFRCLSRTVISLKDYY